MRQNLHRIRMFTLTFSMLLFPLTIWYFSPYLILMAGLRHVINGSFIVFTLMFVLGMFFGRVWCGFLCPTGGMSECFARFSPKEPKQGWRNCIKYALWLLWIAGIIVCHVTGKGSYTVQPFFMTDHGISVSDIHAYVIYYAVVLLFLIPAMVHGRRATCHYLCWMAPFMALGYKLGRALHLPQLRLKTDGSKCVGCNKCRAACPMSLDVPALAKGGIITSAECILCGECAEACGKGVIGYEVSRLPSCFAKHFS